MLKLEKTFKRSVRPFSKTAAEICEGQQLDMEFETRTNVSTDEYIEMIRLKTAVLMAVQRLEQSWAAEMMKTLQIYMISGKP